MDTRHKGFRTLSALLLSGFALSACSTSSIGTAERTSTAAMHDAERDIQESRQPLPALNVAPTQVVSDVYTSGGRARISEHGQALPHQWERADSIDVKNAPTLSLFEIGTYVTGVTGIPVQFAPDVFPESALQVASPSNSSGANANPNGNNQANARNAPPDINQMLGSMGLTGATPASGNTAGAAGGYIRPVVGTRSMMKVDFHGRLSQFLDQVASYFNVSWSYGDGQIRVFRNITRTYTVHALPANLTLKSTLAADASTTNGAGATGQSAGVANAGSSSSVQSSVDIGIWKDITAAVTGIVGRYGEVSAAVSTGTIAVTAPPEIIARVQEYLDGQNARLSKEVAVSVQLLNVSINDTDNNVFNLNGLLSSAASKYGLAFGDIGNSSLSVGKGGLGFTVKSTGNSFNGTSGVIQALQSIGKVTTRTTGTVTTLNNVPAPLQVAHIQGYIAQVAVSNYSTSGTGSATSQTTLTPGTVTTGFSMALLPKINANNTGMLMQYSINFSELNGGTNGFDLYTTPDGAESIQLPNINTRNFVQQAFIPNNSTLVLTGFEQVGDTANKQGEGSANFLGLGGSQTGAHTRNIIVILLSPSILDTDTPAITED